MTDISAYDQHMLVRIDQESQVLASAGEAAAESALGSILYIVQRSGPVVIDHALTTLRQHAANHEDPSRRTRIADTLAQIERMPARPPVAPPPPPAPMPLMITSMQRGKRYRIVQDFQDFDGTPFFAGTVLTFEGYSFFPYDGGYTISFREAGMRLAEIDAGNQSVLENRSNRFFAADGGEPA